MPLNGAVPVTVYTSHEFAATWHPEELCVLRDPRACGSSGRPPLSCVLGGLGVRRGVRDPLWHLLMGGEVLEAGSACLALLLLPAADCPVPRESAPGLRAGDG